MHRFFLAIFLVGPCLPLCAATKPGRVVDDFVAQIDLAPTWLEPSGLKPPAAMNGRSLVPLLKSEKSGIIDTVRDHVIVGRERHEADTRPDLMPYPMRAIRTAAYLYIRNFKPDRWPCRDPYSDEGPKGDPHTQGIGTVVWLVHHRSEPATKPLYDQIHNIASDPESRAVKMELSGHLMSPMPQLPRPK